jgi:hypothetical protein
MPTLELSVPAAVTPAINSAWVSPLLELQLRVARHADALARRPGAERASDRQLWLRAEQEVFSRVELDARAHADSTGRV